MIYLAEKNYDEEITVNQEYLSDLNVQYFYFVNEESQVVADYLISRDAVPTGIKNVIVKNKGEGAAKLLKSFVSKKL